MGIAQLDGRQTYSYADYLDWEFEERVELINGRVFELPIPTTLHQAVSRETFGPLWWVLKDEGPCRVFSAPFDVRLPGLSSEASEIYTVDQPDICVVCNPDKFDMLKNTMMRRSKCLSSGWKNIVLVLRKPILLGKA